MSDTKAQPDDTLLGLLDEAQEICYPDFEFMDEEEEICLASDPKACAEACSYRELIEFNGTMTSRCIDCSEESILQDLFDDRWSVVVQLDHLNLGVKKGDVLPPFVRPVTAEADTGQNESK